MATRKSKTTIISGAPTSVIPFESVYEDSSGNKLIQTNSIVTNDPVGMFKFGENPATPIIECNFDATTGNRSVALDANNLGHRRIAQAIFDSLQAFYARPDGVESLRTESWEVVRTEYFDLHGRALPGRPAKGLCIRRVTYRDGRWESFKEVR